MAQKYDYLIIGSGIIGLSIARELKIRDSNASICIIDKESSEAFHASGRNSGVLHAGFYYTADTLKAKFTVDGNKAMKTYCFDKHIKVNACGKLVVAQNEQERLTLHELQKRGIANGSEVSIISEKQALEIEPNVKTYEEALWSPNTASVNPKEVCASLKKDLEQSGVTFSFNTQYLSTSQKVAQTSEGEIPFKKLINCAGLYADKIAHEFDFGKQYTLIPFKGLYLKYTKNKTDIQTNIYPVPNLKNPFLGVHFTKTVDGGIKIGPTAIPALWRENYSWLKGFKFNEMIHILLCQLGMMIGNQNNFRALAFEEIRKYNRNFMASQSTVLAHNIDPKDFTEYTEPGIRAQLIDRKTLKLIQDFTLDGDKDTLHVLNAISPAFTCAFSFSKFVVKNYL